MPEKMTKEEAMVAHTIDQLRIVKELLKKEATLREASETKERIAYDSLGEVVKVKRPKKTGEKDTTKIENNTGTHSGYGLAGEESHFKKQDEEDLKGICRQKISQIEEGMYSLNKSQLEELYDALHDIVQSIL